MIFRIQLHIIFFLIFYVYSESIASYIYEKCDDECISEARFFLDPVQFVYKDNYSEDDWKLVKKYDSDDYCQDVSVITTPFTCGLNKTECKYDGFYAALYFHTIEEIYVLAFRGTQILDVYGDWKTNFKNFIGLGGDLCINTQYRRAYDIAGSLIGELAKENKRLIVAGHSLGGGIAAYIALRYGFQAYVYNTARNSWLSKNYTNQEAKIKSYITYSEPDYYVDIVSSLGEPSEKTTDLFVETKLSREPSSSELQTVDKLSGLDFSSLIFNVGGFISDKARNLAKSNYDLILNGVMLHGLENFRNAFPKANDYSPPLALKDYIKRLPALDAGSIQSNQTKPQASTKSMDLHDRLPRHYSPVIYQHVHYQNDILIKKDGLEGRSDLILPFNYDGDWYGDNNWINLKNHLGPATVYYSVTETTNYWFIYYAIYHVRDWSTLSIDSMSTHEHDMEAITLMVHKGRGFPGDLIAAMSMSHNLWLEYPIAARVKAIKDELKYAPKFDSNILNPIKIDLTNFEKITDSWIHLDNFINQSTTFNDTEVEKALKDGHHPRVYIQSRGHGIFMDKNADVCLNAGNKLRIDRWDQVGFPHSFDWGKESFKGTGIVYYCNANPLEKGDVIYDFLEGKFSIDSGKGQKGAADSYQDRWAKYQLISIEDALWNKKLKMQDRMFFPYIKDGNALDAFYGTKRGDNKAHPPWSMPASSVCPPGLPFFDDISEPGEIFKNPLTAYPKHFDFEGANIPPLEDEKYIDNPFLSPSHGSGSAGGGFGGGGGGSWGGDLNCANVISDTLRPQATAIVFDHSGSMQVEKKIDYAREAAVAYEKKMEIDDLISVSIFSDRGSTPQGLEIQRKGQIGADWFSRMLANQPNGRTNIGDGLSKGLHQLCTIPSEDARKDALLLSDGLNNVGEYNTMVQKYVEYLIPIHTVKFGQQASEKNLRKIATDTGGSYRAADQFTISNSYSSIFNTINGNSEILATHDLMGPGDTVNYLAAISPGADALNLNASWQGSKLRVMLTSPSGNVYSRDQLPGMNDRYEESKINQFTKIKNPESGTWRIDVEWEIPPNAPERVNLLLSEHTDVYTSILGFNPEYIPGQKVIINVQASDLDGGNNKKPLIDASAWAQVQIPGQEMIRMIHAQGTKVRVYEDVIKDLSRKVELFDDGMHDDYKAGDGIFGGYFTETQLNGSYIVKAYAEGQKEDGSAVSRKSVSSFQVGPLRNTKVNTSQIINFTQKVEEEKLKSKVSNPLGTMQGGSTSQKHTNPVPAQSNPAGGSQMNPVPQQTQPGNSSQSIPATTSGKKKRSRSLMDKISN